MDATWLSWSLKLYRTSTLEVRASWLLGVWMLFDLVRFAQAGYWAMLPFALLVPLASMYLHAMAHVVMARLVGGSADRTVLSMINDITSMQVPLTPSKQFAVGVAGPLVSLVFWLSCSLGAKWLGPAAGLSADLLAYVAGTNFWILVINLLACAFCDGARIWRAILWPLFGLGRAIRWTVMLSFVCSIGIIGLGIWMTDFLLLIVGLMCLFITVQENRSVKLGFDPVLQIEFDAIHDRRSQSWFGRWQQRRRIRALERQEREEREEQEILDRLLTKVSEHGLPSLTDAERATLQRISRKQKERQETGIP
jgi:Zn-dependent protease